MCDKQLFSSEEIEGRFLDLWELAERFQQSYTEKTKVVLKLDVDRLYLIVISTYDDIARYKFYHLSNPYEERSDAIKRAAYLTKWITSFKPFHAMHDDDHEDVDIDNSQKDDSHLVNEEFAISIALVNLNVHCDRDFFLSVEKEYELIYDLMYRNLSDDALMLLYKTFVDVVSQTEFIEIR